MSSRSMREKAFWNEAYGARGLNHEKYLWNQSSSSAAYTEDFFNALLRDFSGLKILTLGGGIDTLGIALAKNNNRVFSVDISEEAALKTTELARQYGVEEHLSAVVMNCEEMTFDENFDLVVCKRALHHMNLSKVVARVHDCLIEGGRFVAEEPICLLKLLRWIHEKLPFHPAPWSEDEVELTAEDLALIKRSFQEVTFHYMEFLTRESLKYYLSKARAESLLRPLGRLDSALINEYLTPLKYLSSYAIFQAVK